jgi:methylated-DNA-[protein]-cysteine S-methyltransferase
MKGNIYSYKTEIGYLAIADNGHAITGIDFLANRLADNYHDTTELDTLANMPADNGHAITGIDTLANKLADNDLDIYIKQGYLIKESPLIKEAWGQLYEYFSGRLFKFDLPLAPSGTDFQQRVWQALKTIPYGQVKSYKDIAIAIGNKNAARAVGMANNKNPIPIIIPCHRVIGANGQLVGYGGGLDIKRYLLNLEGKFKL